MRISARIRCNPGGDEGRQTSDRGRADTVMRRAIRMFFACIIAAGVGTTSALAQEPVGCDKFKWPLDNERTILTSADMPTISSGGSVPRSLPTGVAVTLIPFTESKLPLPPERSPKSQTYAGFIQVPAPARSGTIKITLSSDAWIDVIQDGHIVKSGAFSGALGCQNLRKSVKFDLAAEPFVIQLSDVQANSIAIAITSD
jgi:hypothetical protein